MGVCGFIAYPVCVLVVQFTRVRATAVTDYDLTITGVAGEFVAALEEQRDRQDRLRRERDPAEVADHWRPGRSRDKAEDQPRRRAVPVDDDRDDESAPTARSRSRDKEDEKDEDERSRRPPAMSGGSNAWIYALIGSGAALAVLLACCMVPVIALIMNPPHLPTNPANAGGPILPAKTPDPRSVAEAVQYLNSGDRERQRLAANWLANQPLDAKQQSAVGQALDPLLSDADTGMQEAAMKALFVWATRDNVPSIVRAVDRQTGGNGILTEGMKTLGRLQDVRGTRVIAKQLGYPFGEGTIAVEALRKIGPPGEVELAKFYNEPHDGIRNRARTLLKEFDTKESVIVDASLADLEAKDNNRRAHAADTLSKVAKDPTKLDAISKALNPLLDEPGGAFDAALRALNVWITAENVPALNRACLDPAFAGFAASNHLAAVNLLCKVNDERSIPVFVAFLATRSGENVRAALEKIGPKAEDAVLLYLNHPTISRSARALLQRYKTTDKRLAAQCLDDIAKGDKETKNLAYGFLAQADVDESLRAEVTKALLASAKSASELKWEVNQALALAKWASKDAVPNLLKLTKHPSERVRDGAYDRLAELKEESIALDCVQGYRSDFFHKEQWKVRVLHLGSAAEGAVGKLLLNDNDGNWVVVGVDLLKEIGTKASLPALEALEQKAKAANNKNLQLAVNNAILAIGKRDK